MTTPIPNEIQDAARRCAANIHSWWMRRKHDALNGSAASRNDETTELMVPFDDLPSKDQADDLASLGAVLEQLRREDPDVVRRLIWPDGVLEDQLRQMFAVCDPPPTDLPDRCVASAEAAARAGLDAHRATIAANRDQGKEKFDA